MLVVPSRSSFVPARSSKFNQLIEKLEPRQLLASVPAGFTDQTWGTSFGSGTQFDFAPDGRIFALTQTGSVWVITPSGQRLPTPALTLPVDSFFERGLLGIAFDPSFDANAPGTDYVYLYFTVPAAQGGPFNRIARFEVNGDTIDLASQTNILDLNPLGAGNHNGGGLHFGPDGKLYLGVGENATGSNCAKHQQPAGQDPARESRSGQPDPHRQPHQLPGDRWDNYREQPRHLGRRIAKSVHLRLGGPMGDTSSMMSAITPGKKSTSASPARTTAGPTPKGCSTKRAFRISPSRFTTISTARACSAATRSSAASSCKAPPPRNGRRRTTANTSLAITSTTGSPTSIWTLRRRPTLTPISPPARPGLSTCSSARTDTFTT